MKAARWLRRRLPDAEGRASLKDEVDNHWTLGKAICFSTLLSVIRDRHQQQREVPRRGYPPGGVHSFSQVGEQVAGRSLNVQPTITIRPGFPVRVMVTHDLVLEPYPA